MGRKVNTKKPFSCAPVLTEEDIEKLEDPEAIKQILANIEIKG